MKGQTQALTAVLITSVVVGSVATAYVWGTPILEKSQSKADLKNTESSILRIHEKTLQVAESGEGATERIEITSNEDSEELRLEVDEAQDYIDIVVRSQQPPYPYDTWSLIKGKSLQNLTFGQGDYALEGDDLPGVVAVRTAGGAGTAVLTYRIEFRNMYVTKPTGSELEKIDLTTRGKKTSTGETTLIISNKGTKTDKVVLPSGETIEQVSTKIELDIR